MPVSSLLVIVLVAPAAPSGPALDGGRPLAPTASPTPHHAPSQPAASQPAVDPGAGAQVQGLRLESCHAWVARGEYLKASACYSARVAHSDSGREVRAAAALAQLSQDMQTRREAAVTTQPQKGEEKPQGLNAFVLDGKAELTLSSGLYGLWVGGLTVGTIASLGLASAGDPLSAALLASTGLLFPVLLGVSGAGAALLVSLGVDAMTPGDAALLRSSMYMGLFNSLAYASLVTFGPWDSPLRQLVFPGMLLTSTLLPALGAGTAAFVDLSAGSVATASSTALWSGVITVLALGMSGFALDQGSSTLLVAGVSNAAWLAGLLAAPWVPLSRPETWALDLGAALGLLLGGALTIGLDAPNMFIGFGGMAAGTVAGGALGLGAALFGGALLQSIELPEIPDIVAVAPLLAPSAPGHAPLVGVQLGFRL